MTFPTIAGCVAVIVVAATCPACADDVSCGEFPVLSTNPLVRVGRIASGSARVHFVSAVRAGCPNTTPACAERAYVVPGDPVILTMTRDAFVCATFIDSKGVDTSGWLPAAAVDTEPEPAPSAGWLGTWSRTEAEIVFKPGKGAALLIEGNATFGASDPRRVRRGAVNVGEIEAEVTPAGDRLNFTEGGGSAEEGGESSCRVWMRQIGRWLIVDDNGNCGGLNVSFRGYYVHKP